MSSQGSDASELVHYLRLLWRRLWLIILLPVLAGVIGYVVVKKTEHKMFTASSSVILQQSATEGLLGSVSGTTSGGSSGGGGGNSTPSATGNAIQLIESRPVALAVLKQFPQLGKGKGGFPLASASLVSSSDVVRITVTARRPKIAASVANAYATTYVNYEQSQLNSQVATAVAALQHQLTGVKAQIAAVNNQVAEAPSETRSVVQSAVQPTLSTLTSQQSTLSQRLTTLQLQPSFGSSGVQVLSQAEPPGAPSSPDAKKDAIIAAAGGLILALAIILLMELADDRIRVTSELVRAAPGVEILAALPARPEGRRTWPILRGQDQDPELVNSYWQLKAVVDNRRRTGDLDTFLVAGPEGTEGAASVAANLAMTMAKGGVSVLLVDADLRSPSVHEVFNLGNDVGFGQVATGTAELATALQPVPDLPSLSVLTAGPARADAADILGSPRARRTVRDLPVTAAACVIVAPPINHAPDAGLLASVVSGVVVVVAKNRTGRGGLGDAISSIARVANPYIGVVVNGRLRIPNQVQTPTGTEPLREQVDAPVAVTVPDARLAR